MLLTDGSLGNGSQLFKIPKMADMPEIKTKIVEANDKTFADGYAQAVTFGLLMARAKDIRLGGTEGIDAAICEVAVEVSAGENN